MKVKILHILLLVLSQIPMALHAGRPMLTARLDSTTMLMGNVTTLNLEVVQDKGLRGEFPLFRNFGERGYVTLLNDTIELSTNIKADTTEIGSGRIQINYKVPVQVFDSGYYKLPEFVFLCGNDSAVSKPLELKVVPVNVKADDQISPMTDVAEPENKSIFDALPDWLVKYWWIFLLLIAVAVATWLLWKRYRTEGAILPKKPETPPYELAMERLRRLKARKLWESGQEKEFYTLLTDILRSYLDSRFGIKAMEMTSREIMSTLADNPELRDSRGMMRQILDMADFVKFAMVRPLPDDNVKAFDNAVTFVEATKPLPPAETADANAHAGQKSAGSAAESADTGKSAGRNAGKSAVNKNTNGKGGEK